MRTWFLKHPSVAVVLLVLALFGSGVAHGFVKAWAGGHLPWWREVCFWIGQFGLAWYIREWWRRT